MGGTGCQLAPGRASPAAAVVAAPVVEWPLRVVDDHDRALSLGAALGPGGDQVEGLLGAVIGVGDGDAVDVPALARSTPAGHVGLPLAVVPLAEGVEVADRVDREW